MGTLMPGCISLSANNFSLLQKQPEQRSLKAKPMVNKYKQNEQIFYPPVQGQRKALSSEHLP